MTGASPDQGQKVHHDRRTNQSLATEYRNEIGLAAATLFVLLLVVAVDLARAGDSPYLTKPWANATEIVRHTSLWGIFALGAAVVIISGGIDLSSGSVIAFSGSVFAIVLICLAPRGDDGVPDTTALSTLTIMIAITAAMSAGFCIGTLHAWLITVVGLPPFVATLASLVGLRSLARILNPSIMTCFGIRQTRINIYDTRLADMGQAWWLPLLIFLIVGGLLWLMMTRTIVGRHLYAMGGNEQAAQLSGIRTDRLKWLAYCTGAISASIAGVLYTLKVGSINPQTLGVAYELNAIAAAVVGGCSLQGGLGTIPGVMLGVLFLRMVIDAVAKLIKSGSDDYEGLIVGFLVVVAVALNEWRRQIAGTTKQFFPGTMGNIIIPVLALFVGAILGVMLGDDQVGFNFRQAATAGGSAFVILATVKFSEVIRATREMSQQAPLDEAKSR